MSRRRKSFWSKVLFELETSFVGKQFNKFLRKTRSRTKKKQKSSSGNSVNQVGFFVKLQQWVLIVVVILLVVVPVGGLFLRYIQLELNPSPLDQGFSRPEILDDRLNILIATYENSNSYSFLDFVGMMSIDRSTNRVRLVLINADFAIKSDRGGYIELRRSLARSELVGLSPLDELSDKVSTILGIQIDRYLVTESPDLVQIFEKLNINYVSEQAVTDKDIGTVDAGELVEGSKLAAYLAAEEEGSNLKMVRIIDFLTYLAGQNKNIFTAARFLLNLDFMVESVETNLSRNELIQVTNVLWRTGDFKASYVDILDTSRIEEGDKVYYAPNLQKVGDKMERIFIIPEVVREQVRIEIYNATGKNGLAGQHQRWLESLGANVVRTATYPDILDESVLYNPDRSHSRNVELIERVTRGKVEELNEVYPFNHTGELVLVLGKDILQSDL